MNEREALKLALEALELHLTHHEHGCVYLDPAVTAIKEVLAQPELTLDGLTPTEFALRELYEFQEATGCDTAAEFKAQPEQDEKFCDANCVWTDHHPDCKLAQPEQEPVAWAENDGEGNVLWGENCFTDDPDWLDNPMPLYTTPPQREWVGLTDDEVTDCYLDSSEKGILLEDAIEAKLKEKNA